MTDENNHIIDVDISEVNPYDSLNDSLLAIPGIVETGLFMNLVDILIVGKKNHAEKIVVEKDRKQTTL